MPPGCVIPVHHDTGLWVQHTHRIHVAVTTDVAEVRKGVFRGGGGVGSGEGQGGGRYLCAP